MDASIRAPTYTAEENVMQQPRGETRAPPSQPVVVRLRVANSRVDHARQKEKKEDTRYNYATQRRGREIKTGEEGGASIHDICIKIVPLPIQMRLLISQGLKGT